jgi:hypothetical protein
MSFGHGILGGTAVLLVFMMASRGCSETIKDIKEGQNNNGQSNNIQSNNGQRNTWLEFRNNTGPKYDPLGREYSVRPPIHKQDAELFMKYGPTGRPYINYSEEQLKIKCIPEVVLPRGSFDLECVLVDSAKQDELELRARERISGRSGSGSASGSGSGTSSAGSTTNYPDLTR